LTRHNAVVGLLLLALLWSASAVGDVFRPAYLELEAKGDGVYSVLWRVPAKGQLRMGIYVQFPDGTTELSSPQAMLIDGYHVERWRVEREGGLAGGQVSISGLIGGVTDVVARVIREDGSVQVERLMPENPSFRVTAPAGPWQVVETYTVLGFEHILLGVDHLLFVLALLLIVRGVRRIVATVTAFTIAHSLTLVAATMGWVHAPGPPVEAIIALSIVFVAAEVVQEYRGKTGLTARSPWLVAFSFGLLHGFGFASALTDMGLPAASVPLALLMFNLGVELGQLAFVAAVLALTWSWRTLGVVWPKWSYYVPPYVIGGVASFWTLERVIVGFWV